MNGWMTCEYVIYAILGSACISVMPGQWGGGGDNERLCVIEPRLPVGIKCEKSRHQRKDAKRVEKMRKEAFYGRKTGSAI